MTTHQYVRIWPSPANSITIGEPLEKVRLVGGVATVEGTFTFMEPNMRPPVGKSAQKIIFTPSGGEISPVEGTAEVLVHKLIPTITWPTIPDGYPSSKVLEHTDLVGGEASVPGKFVLAVPKIAPPRGISVQHVYFLPADTINHKSVIGTVTLKTEGVTGNVGIPSRSQSVPPRRRIERVPPRAPPIPRSLHPHIVRSPRVQRPSLPISSLPSPVPRSLPSQRPPPVLRVPPVQRTLQPAPSLPVHRAPSARRPQTILRSPPPLASRPNPHPTPRFIPWPAATSMPRRAITTTYAPHPARRGNTNGVDAPRM